MPRVTLTCPICDTVFTTPLSQVLLRKRRCCSKACGSILASHPRSSFWDHVEKTDGCWIWMGSLSPNGYGRWDRHSYAHRVSYIEANGQIPEGMELDHLCHNADAACRGGPTCLHRRCVRPDHLEPVSHRTNLARGGSTTRRTHCIRNHPWDESNTYRPKRGGRMCRACRREALQRSRASRT